MKGKIEQFETGGRKCTLYLPPEYGNGRCYPAVYVNGIDELPGIVETTEPCFGKECAPFLLLNVDTVDWNDDMTPWPAPPITKKSRAFGGCAAAYLDTLAQVIKPYVDARYATRPEPENTCLVGYSLGGLTALYALYTQDAFGRIGSLSGSLWYENWLGFMATRHPLNKNAAVYLSLGSKETESKNKKMAAVGRCTLKAVEFLRSQLDNENKLTFEWNDGGHFTDIPQRFRRALLWLMKAE